MREVLSVTDESGQGVRIARCDQTKNLTGVVRPNLCRRRRARNRTDCEVRGVHLEHGKTEVDNTEGQTEEDRCNDGHFYKGRTTLAFSMRTPPEPGDTQTTPEK